MQAALAAVDTEGARRATEVSTAASAAQTHRTSSDVHRLSICDLNTPQPVTQLRPVTNGNQPSPQRTNHACDTRRTTTIRLVDTRAIENL